MTIKSYLSTPNFIVLISFVDLFGVSAMITFLSSHVKSFDVSTTAMGVFFSLYGGLQFLSSYVVGYLSDRYGQLTMMLVCSLLSSFGYATLGMATSFEWLCLSRCITGIFKHTQTIGRALLASSADQNSHKLGYFSSLGSAGFMVGPLIGGWMYDRYDFKMLAFMNSFMFFIIFLISLFLKLFGEKSILNQSSKNVKRSDQSKFTWKQTLPSIWDLFLIQFILGFGMIIFRTNYSYTLSQRFEASGTVAGLITSYSGVVGTASSLLTVHVFSWYGPSKWSLLLHLIASQCASMFLCAVTPYVFVYALLQTIISFVNAISRECFLYLWLTRTSKDNMGKMIGMSGSLMAFARLICPFIGSVIQEYIITGPMYTAFLCALLAVIIISREPIVIQSESSSNDRIKKD